MVQIIKGEMMKLLSLFCFIFSNSIVYAKNNNSLELLLKKVSENNQQFLSQKVELKRANDSVKSQYGSFLPSISLEAKKLELTTRNDNDDTTTKTDQANLKATYNIFNGMSDKAELSIAQLEYKLAMYQLHQLNSNLTYEVKSSFYEVVYNQKYLALAKVISKRRKEQLDLINLRYRGGREDKGSYLQAKAKYNQASNDIQQALYGLENSKQLLSYLLGGNSADLTPFNFQFVSKKKSYYFKNTENLIIKTPDYQISDINKMIASKQVTLADNSHMPSLDLVGSFGKQGDSFNDLDTDNKSISLNLTIPLFDGGTPYYKSVIARKNVNIKKHSLNSIRQKLKYTIKMTLNQYENSWLNLNNAKSFYNASKIRAEVSTQKYKSGLTDYTNWDLVQNELINYEKNHLLALKNLYLAEANIDKVLGKGELNEK